MTHRRAPLAALLVLPLVLLAAPTHAQEADTTEAAPSSPDTTAADTTQTAPPDTAAADTAITDAPNVEAAQVPTTPDTLTTDTTTAGADTTATDPSLSTAARRERAKEQARAAAEAWLSLTDEGQFGASWDEAAASLQRSISREAWQKRGVQARSRLRSPTNRELTRAVYRDSTAQLPGGTPVVALQYSTNFEGGRALEAVITAKQGGGWKVAGYRVVPNPDTARATDTTQATPQSDTAQAPAQPDSTQPPPQSDSLQAAPQPDTTNQSPQPDSSRVEPDSTEGPSS